MIHIWWSQQVRIIQPQKRQFTVPQRRGTPRHQGPHGEAPGQPGGRESHGKWAQEPSLLLSAVSFFCRKKQARQGWLMWIISVGSEVQGLPLGAQYLGLGDQGRQTVTPSVWALWELNKNRLLGCGLWVSYDTWRHPPGEVFYFILSRNWLWRATPQRSTSETYS